MMRRASFIIGLPVNAIEEYVAYDVIASTRDALYTGTAQSHVAFGHTPALLQPDAAFGHTPALLQSVCRSWVNGIYDMPIVFVQRRLQGDQCGKTTRHFGDVTDLLRSQAAAQ